MTARRVWVERRPDGAHVAVYWSVTDEASPGFAGYHVYRSPQPCDALSSPSLERLTDEPLGVPFLVNEVEPLAVPSYLVTRIDDAGERVIDRPVQVGDTSDADRQGRGSVTLSMPHIYAEFRRRKDLLLGFNGESVTVLIRRMAGQRCTECFSGSYEASIRAACGSCFGTGWSRGYEVVDDVLMRISSPTEALKLQPPGLVFSSNPKSWLVGFPLLRQGDVVARPAMGTRYEVQKIDAVVHQGILTHQDFELVAFDPGHPIYAFPL